MISKGRRQRNMAFAKQVIWITTLLLALFSIQDIQAEETDQFTLPPGELVDIGPTVSRRLFKVIENAIAKTNLEIQALLPKAKQSRNAAIQLARRSSDAYIVDLIYNETGIGLPESTYERWLRWGGFAKKLQPMRFNEAWPWQTVYWLVFSQCPGSLIFLSPTINMYGYYFGTDKIGHFFQQGQGYYKIYMRYLAKGKSIEHAHAAMIAHGQRQEDGFFGTMLNGVFSNGDLSGNYAGWKFYMNLAHEVKIGKATLSPIIAFKDNQWTFAKKINKDNLLKPYINDNLNEAWNPCHYFFMRSVIRSNIKKRCGVWFKRKGLTRKMVLEKRKETNLWQGEDYGHWLPKDEAVTLDACFGGR